MIEIDVFVNKLLNFGTGREVMRYVHSVFKFSFLSVIPGTVHFLLTNGCIDFTSSTGYNKSQQANYPEKEAFT